MKAVTEPGAAIRNLVIAGLAVGILAGCTVVGPSAVRNGRLAYNQAINETNNQQMLLAVVQNRYDETASLLAVASVTANVTVTASSGVQLGFGDSDNYQGSLVPFSAGTIYEENPTISYVPVAGARYAEKIFSPIPVSVFAKLTAALADPGFVYGALVSSVNGVRNPDFLFPADSPAPGFGRFVEIMTLLTHAHRLHWVERSDEAGAFSIVIHDYAPDYLDETRELMALLNLPVPADDPADLVLPVSLALNGSDSSAVGITLRSVIDLVELLSAAIDLPEADQRSGFAASYPPRGLAGRDLRVRFSEERPGSAAVSVPYRDGWFFIDESDRPTKRFFKLLSALWSVTIADSTSHMANAPVLTVPVSR